MALHEQLQKLGDSALQQGGINDDALEQLMGGLLADPASQLIAARYFGVIATASDENGRFWLDDAAATALLGAFHELRQNPELDPLVEQSALVAELGIGCRLSSENIDPTLLGLMNLHGVAVNSNAVNALGMMLLVADPRLSDQKAAAVISNMMKNCSEFIDAANQRPELFAHNPDAEEALYRLNRLAAALPQIYGQTPPVAQLLTLGISNLLVPDSERELLVQAWNGELPDQLPELPIATRLQFQANTTPACKPTL